ncbi:hypothetical protein E4T50_00088 [Aureobasidium sp. EXF-12298]|nr:hypothetical protein E4T50_00088 [Aureobasidium sp. EXF-12298]KAI4760002.1 hypothetical protein E4T51_06977 [Aureobasidium sp. EXF-12344]KAI4783025.1 hypothetical protein E4T52_02070 [Aureobasidium sp. EXF-3400]
MFGEKTTTHKSTSSSPTSTPSKPSSPQTMTPRHAELESSHPAAFFGKKPTKSAMVSEKERRDSVSSTATTATSSSVTSSATTIAAPSQTAAPEKPFDVFEYQTAGYLSMPMTHESQPYLQGQPSSERKGSASSSSSAGSLWSKAKNKIHRKSPSAEEQEKKEKEKQERKKEYETLGLDEKVKFGTKGGMNMVG